MNYLVIRLKLTSSARCAVLELNLTPSVSMFDGGLAVFNSNGLPDCECGLALPLATFGGCFTVACDGDGFRTIAPPGTSACLSLSNNVSLTCNSAGCCTTIFGRL